MEDQGPLMLNETISELFSANEKIETKKRPSRESSGGGNWKYQCDYCGIGYHTMGSVTSHRCRKHKAQNTKKDKEYICFKCGEMFETSIDVMQHALIHQSETPYNCKKCGLNFINEKMLSRHIVGAHGTLNTTVKLETSESPKTNSPKIAVEESNFETNDGTTTETSNTSIIENDTAEEKPLKKLGTDTFKGYGNWEYQCDFCGIGYHTTGSVTGHRSRKHKRKENQIFKCYGCEEVFENSYEVKQHALVHQSDTPFACELCGLGFTTENNLFKHTVGAHGAHREAGSPTNKNTPIPSESAAKPLEELLQKHGLLNEPTEATTTTPLVDMRKRKLSCNKSLKELFDQDRQSRKRPSGFSSAGGNWEYQCDYCGMGYHTIGSISSHRWRKHEKPDDHAYRCFKCKEIFTSSLEVMQHALVHLEATPFSCETCGLNFTSDTLLNKHKTGAHGIHRHQVKTVTVQSTLNNEDAVGSSEDTSQLECTNEIPVEDSFKFQAFDAAETSNATTIIDIKREMMDQLEQSLDRTDASLPVETSLLNIINNHIQASSSAETTPVPLPVVVYQRAANSGSEITVTWIHELELHTVTSVCLNSGQSLLCVRQNEDIFSYSDNLKKLIKANQPQSVNFTIIDGDDEATQWTLFTFGDRPVPTGLKNKLFKSYQMLEMTLREYAAIEQKSLVHLVQFSENSKDIFSLLDRQMMSPIIGCNRVY